MLIFNPPIVWWIPGAIWIAYGPLISRDPLLFLRPNSASFLSATALFQVSNVAFMFQLGTLISFARASISVSFLHNPRFS